MPTLESINTFNLQNINKLISLQHKFKTKLFSCKICFDVHRAQEYCFGLIDLIRYSEYPGEDLSTQIVKATP